jgi:hypothetical protein
MRTDSLVWLVWVGWLDIRDRSVHVHKSALWDGVRLGRLCTSWSTQHVGVRYRGIIGLSLLVLTTIEALLFYSSSVRLV